MDDGEMEMAQLHENTKENCVFRSKYKRNKGRHQGRQGGRTRAEAKEMEKREMRRSRGIEQGKN